MKAFCPRCGSDTDGIGPRHLCPTCYLEDHELIEGPEQITVRRCSVCDSVKIKNRWVETESFEDLLSTVLNRYFKDDSDAIRSIQYEPDEENPGSYDITLYVEKVIDGEALQQPVETRLTVKNDQCNTCARMHGGYYEYKVQIRGEVDEDVLNTALDTAASVTNRARKHFMSDLKQVHGGYDLYLSSRTIAEEVLKELAAEYDITRQRSRELVGQNREGIEIYRTVIVARIQ